MGVFLDQALIDLPGILLSLDKEANGHA
jgi:hypothetical protein